MEWAPAPMPRNTDTREVTATEEKFTGFVFKIQANMDPKHRDRVAFMRVVSGKYEKGMKLRQVRIGKDVVISDALTFMAGDRSHVEEAYPGDIIGLHNHGTIQIGDTFTRGRDDEVHRYSELRAGTVPSYSLEGSAEAETAAERAGSAL